MTIFIKFYAFYTNTLNQEMIYMDTYCENIIKQINSSFFSKQINIFK